METTSAVLSALQQQFAKAAIRCAEFKATLIAGPTEAFPARLIDETPRDWSPAAWERELAGSTVAVEVDDSTDLWVLRYPLTVADELSALSRAVIDCWPGFQWPRPYPRTGAERPQPVWLRRLFGQQIENLL